MLIDNKKASEMQTAVDLVFARLPEVFKTDHIRNEIAKNVAQSQGNYEDAARRSVIGMFATIDKAIENRTKLANFRKKA